MKSVIAEHYGKVKDEKACSLSTGSLTTEVNEMSMKVIFISKLIGI
jgi:hypothetical protein